MSQDDFASLKARLQALEDKSAIQETLNRYCQGIDYGFPDQVVDCFTGEMVREICRPDGSVNRWEGLVGTREFANGHSHAPDKYHKHLALNCIIELHGDTADVSSYMFRFDAGDGEKSHIWGLGRQQDTMRRDPDGRWRIEKRVTHIEDHWPGRSRPATGLVAAGAPTSKG